MSITTETNNPMWATIGKVGAFISLLIALFTLYGQINPDKASVRAVCQIVELLEKPKSLKPQVISSGDLPASTPTSNSPSKSKESKERSSKDAVVAAAQAAASAAEARIEILRTIGAPQFALRCELFNTGRQEAKDVVLDLPYEAKAVRVGDKPLAASQISDKSVNLGVIRPGAKIPLVVWGESYIYRSEREENYSLSYSGGVGTFQLPTLAYGWTGNVVSFLDFVTRNPFTILFLLAPLAPMLALKLRSIFSNSENRSSQSPPESTRVQQTAVADQSKASSKQTPRHSAEYHGEDDG